MKTLSKLFLITMIIASLYAVLAVATGGCKDAGMESKAGLGLEVGASIFIVE